MTQNVNEARFARNVERGFFCNFQPPCSGLASRTSRALIRFPAQFAHACVTLSNESSSLFSLQKPKPDFKVEERPLYLNTKRGEEEEDRKCDYGNTCSVSADVTLIVVYCHHECFMLYLG